MILRMAERQNSIAEDNRLSSLLFRNMPADLQRHSINVALYAGILYRHAAVRELCDLQKQLSEGRASDIASAMLLHDIGKLKTPLEILYKAVSLNPSEWAVMRNHPCDGVALLKKAMCQEQICGMDIIHPETVYEVIQSHHERWDGKGYPHGLAGREIPLAARVCAIADTYDAITADRVYHQGSSHEQACRLIEADAGKQFDPDLVQAFKRYQGAFFEYLQKLSAGYPQKACTKESVLA